MNIYFTASISGKKHYLSNYQKIIDVLQKYGHKVTSEHIIDASENQIDMESHEEREKFHKQLKKWIIKSDCVVVEVSFPSISIGFEISLALSLGKPVLILYTKDAPSLLSSYENEKLMCMQYNIHELKNILEDFLNYVHGNTSRRFTFFVSSQIDAYLESVSRKKHIPKAVYIRNLIEKDRDSS